MLEHQDTILATPQERAHLLVVDDELEVAKTLVRQFRRKYQVHAATNAQEAYDILIKWPIRVVIADQRMPGTTGVEFFAKIKQTHPDTIRLLLTGYADIEAVIAAINEGNVFRYIKKPWDAVELERVLEEAYQHNYLVAKNRSLLSELQQSEQRYRALFEDSPVALWEMDLTEVRQAIDQLAISRDDNFIAFCKQHPQIVAAWSNTVRILELNSASVKLFEAQDKGDLTTTLLRPSFQTDMLAFFQELFIALATGHLDHRREVILRTLQSRELPVAIQSSILPGCENTWSRIVLAIIDITEPKRSEVALQNALARETELSQLRWRIIDTVSHEFRTPLAVILSSSQILQRYGDKITEHDRAEHFGKISSSIRYTTSLLDDALTINQIQSGELRFQPALLDVAALCQKMITETQATWKTSARFVFSSTGDCTEGMVDERLLHYIMSKLLSNAVKFSPPDSVISIHLACAPKQIVLKVQDRGIGIPKADQANLFSLFYRAENISTARGMGLGLAIVKQSVDLHGGAITFESEVGVGTTFTVIFPKR